MKYFIILFWGLFLFVIVVKVNYFYAWDKNLKKARYYQSKVSSFLDSMDKHKFELNSEYSRYADSFNYYQDKTSYYNQSPDKILWAKSKE